MPTLLLYLGNCSPKKESEGESGCRAVSEKEKETQIIETNRKKQVGVNLTWEIQWKGTYRLLPPLKVKGDANLDKTYSLNL